jgi:hypothetical protein
MGREQFADRIEGREQGGFRGGAIPTPRVSPEWRRVKMHLTG